MYQVEDRNTLHGSLHETRKKPPLFCLFLDLSARFSGKSGEMIYDNVRLMKIMSIFFMLAVLPGCGSGMDLSGSGGDLRKPWVMIELTQHREIFDPVTGETIEITEEGSLFINLYPSIAPKTVNRFATLAQEGFYDGMYFHRVEGPYVQIGDPDCRMFSDAPPPESCDGVGGSGETISSESKYAGFANAKSFKRGSISMALNGRDGDPPYDLDSGDSQFFFCLNASECGHLNEHFTIFGEVVGGLNFLDQIQKDKDKIINIIYEP